MDDKTKVLLCAAGIITASMLFVKTKKRASTRREWTKPWLLRRQSGRDVLAMLNKELLVEDPDSYKNYLRLTNAQFEKLLKDIQADIIKEDTCMRDSISARSRLEVTLRFLATGESYRSLMYATRIHESTISRIVPEVCRAIYKHLKKDYLNTPTDINIWEEIAKDFQNLWQFPHCVGVLDGRHIKFRPPMSEGSYYYNYKGDHSIVLLGMADAKYRFTYVNLGVNGRVSDGGVFRESALSSCITENLLNFPSPAPLPGRIKSVPYVILADDAFPLTNQIMKPYPQRGLSHDCKVFNYRLSRARRLIESTFGILANRFRILLHPINLGAEKVELITLACVVLHNYLATENTNQYTDISTSDNDNVAMIHVLGKQGGNKSSIEAREIRNEFRDYFCSAAGSVPWQEKAIAAHNM